MDETAAPGTTERFRAVAESMLQYIGPPGEDLLEFLAKKGSELDLCEDEVNAVLSEILATIPDRVSAQEARSETIHVAEDGSARFRSIVEAVENAPDVKLGPGGDEVKAFIARCVIQFI